MSANHAVDQEAAFLLRQFEHPELALDHAEWAFNLVQKTTTKEFWENVIKTIKQHLQ